MRCRNSVLMRWYVSVATGPPGTAVATKRGNERIRVSFKEGEALVMGGFITAQNGEVFSLVRMRE